MAKMTLGPEERSLQQYTDNVYGKISGNIDCFPGKVHKSQLDENRVWACAHTLSGLAELRA